MTVFLFFIPLTIVFLLCFGIAAMYLCMGALLLARGYKEKSEHKANRGLLAIVISLPVAIVVVYGYIEWVWLW